MKPAIFVLNLMTNMNKSKIHMEGQAVVIIQRNVG